MHKSAEPKRKKHHIPSEIHSMTRNTYPNSQIVSAAERQEAFTRQLQSNGLKPQTEFDHVTCENRPALNVEELPDGGICPKGFKPGPAMENGTSLPGRVQLKLEQEGPESGYTFQPHAVPFHVGPMEDLIVDGTSWANNVNEYIKTVSDGLPEMPMIACMIGGIGAGKSTALASLLSVYANSQCFGEVHCFSSSMGLDPLMLTVQYLRDPQVNMQFHAELDFQFLKKLHDDVLEEYAEYAKLAKIGKFHKPDKSENQLTRNMKVLLKDTHSLQHPYLDNDGKLHGEKLRLPAYGQNSLKFMSPLEIQMHTLGQPTRTTNGGGYNRHLIMDHQREYRLACLKREANLPFSTLFDEKGRELYGLDKINPRLTNTRDMNSVVIDMHVEDPDFNAMTARQKMMVSALEKGEKVLDLAAKKKGKLLIFDDCAYAFHRPGSQEFKKWITMIRHTHCAAIFCFQQVTAVPPIVRTCATHLMLWRQNCAKEMKRLEDEWGGCVPDFLGAYHAATSRQKEHEKDFLFVDLRKGVANRGFAGKVVPTNEIDDAHALAPKTDNTRKRLASAGDAVKKKIKVKE